MLNESVEHEHEDGHAVDAEADLFGDVSNKEDKEEEELNFFGWIDKFLKNFPK